MNDKNNDDDTQIRRALNVEFLVDDEQETQLTRIADALSALANVFDMYPARHRETWESADWQKDLRDLGIACDQLREHSAALRAIAAGLPLER
jgi:hypothetical protein